MRITYDEVSPFTGNRRVMIEPDPEKQDNMKVCMDTGYHTYAESWKKESDVIDIIENTFPSILLDTKRVMDDGNIWYKLMLVTPFVMLIPERFGDNESVWAIYALKNGNPETDEIVMEIAAVDGTPLYRSIDVDTRKEFPDEKFELAMDAFQSVGAAVYGKIFEMAKSETEAE
jgi:hypothetical protein